MAEAQAGGLPAISRGLRSRDDTPGHGLGFRSLKDCSQPGPCGTMTLVRVREQQEPTGGVAPRGLVAPPPATYEQAVGLKKVHRGRSLNGIVVWRVSWV